MENRQSSNILNRGARIRNHALEEIKVKLTERFPRNGKSCPFCGQEVEVKWHRNGEEFSLSGCKHLNYGGGQQVTPSQALKDPRAWQNEDVNWPWSGGWPVVQ